MLSRHLISLTSTKYQIKMSGHYERSNSACKYHHSTSGIHCSGLNALKLPVQRCTFSSSPTKMLRYLLCCQQWIQLQSAMATHTLLIMCTFPVWTWIRQSTIENSLEYVIKCVAYHDHQYTVTTNTSYGNWTSFQYHNSSDTNIFDQWHTVTSEATRCFQISYWFRSARFRKWWYLDPISPGSIGV